MHFVQTDAISTKTDIWKAAQARLSFAGTQTENYGKKTSILLSRW